MRAIKSKWLLVCGLVLLFGLAPQVRGGTAVWTVLDPHYVPQNDPGFAEVLPGEDMDGHAITWYPGPHSTNGGVRFWPSWSWGVPMAGDTVCFLYDSPTAIIWWRGTFNNPSDKIQIQLRSCDNNDGWLDIYVDGTLEYSYNSFHAAGTDVTIVGEGLSNIPHTVSIQTRANNGGDVSLDYVAIPLETGSFPKWEQPPKKADPNNIFYGWNEPSIHNSDWQIAADDWFCDTNLPVTHVVWWGSFLDWNSPDADWLMPNSFHIAIWKDVPANPPDEPWSHPGTVIYEADVDISNYTYEWVGWDFDPRAFELGDPPFEACFRFKAKLPDPFYQDPAQDSIYWISIAADYTGGDIPEYVWGWKTRPRNPDSPAPDDAVRIFDPTSAHFGEAFVNGEPIEWPDGKSWDLAFKLVSYEGDEVLKWRQDPNENLTGLHAHDYEDTDGNYHSIVLADQWICSGGEVHDLHWFGNYETDPFGNEIRGAGINTFHLSIHKHDPGVQLPIDPEDWGIDVPFASVSETDTGLVNLEGCKIYQYTYILTDPYLQEQGQVYWLDIMAKANDPADHPVWRWQEARRGSPPIVAPAAQKSDGGPWTHISWGVDPQIYSDMAFWVSSQVGDEPVVKWLQPPAPFDPNNTYHGWDEYSVYNSDIQIVADDWYCDSDAPVTDVHWWGSFLGYDDPNVPYDLPVSFHIGIWSDVPVSVDNPFSRPGYMKWQHICYDYTIKFVGWDIDPRNQVPPEATFYFECYLPESEWFHQDPGDNIYWVSIAADYSHLPTLPQNPFGMKTRPRDPDSRAPDDAVIIFDPTAPGVGSLFNLGTPIEWPTGKSWDLAFILTTNKESNIDWGDAPVIAGAIGYPTIFANNGARHNIGGPWLGVATDFPDAEPDGQPNIPATGDNNDIDPLNPGPNHDDENGVTFPAALYVNQTVTINVEVNGGGGFVDGWIDYNSDTVWQASEQIHNALLPDGTNPITFTVPSTAVVGDTYARFRISSAGGLSPEGLATDGEVEDYRIYIREAPTDLDWGDAPDSVVALGYPTLAASNGARHTIVANGPWLGDAADGPDDEPDGQPFIGAIGDDLDTGAGNPIPNYDDEDGVFIPPLIAGHTVYITIEVNGGGGSGGIVQGWIDYDGNQVWDAAEEIPALGVNLPPGTHFIPVTPPSSAVNQTYARFRISSAGGLPPDGPATDGEVEDHLVKIDPPPANMKWAQWPDTTPNGIDIRVDKDRIIADDFLCTFPSLLTDVHFWGSWKDDIKGQIINIHLSIHSDDPVGLGGTDPDNTYSKPDVLLWEDDFNPFEFEESVYVNLFNPEWWWDPATGELIADGDKTIWKYDIQINPANAFLQNGTADNPVIYWLDIQVDIEEDIENTEFGWKTRQYPDHFMDDAVFDRGNELPRIWKELRYPPGHPYHDLDPNSIDMSFVLTFEELSSEPFDFGDAPDSFLPTIPPYPTQLVNDGARHTVVPGVYLGSSIVDVELDGQQSLDALGDDNYDGYDDEDGVEIITVPLVPGGWGELEVTASVDGFLYGWIDFNQNGSWADMGDQIFSGVEVDGGMVTPLTFKVPMTAKPNNTTFARFRYTTTSANLSYDGQASDGEVEDYTVLIGNRCGIKWVQTPDETEFGIDIRVDDSDGYSRILADDFLCTAVDRITRVYLWGSWKNDVKGEIKNIHLSFHSDNPTGPGGYSIPDVLLWEGDFEPNDIQESLYTISEPNEYWWDPVTGTLIPKGDSQIWLVQVNIDPEEAFLQKGSKDNPVIYWLDVQAKTVGGEFGWKTQTYPWFQFQDTAVWGLSTTPGWNEMPYPSGHPHSAGLGRIDMAFMLTTDEFCPGSADLNCDGVVDLIDWSIFTSQWLHGIWP